MKIKPIELHDISRYRGELMGAAMLFVILFHVMLSRNDPFFGLRRCGNVGVDMFLFLSGAGLWHAWTKTPVAAHYFLRRFARIYPAWLLVAAVFYLHNFFTTAGGGYSRDVPSLVANIMFGWSFWRSCDLTFWYVPATMVLYIIAPAYISFIRRNPFYRWMAVVAMVWCVCVQWVAPIHAAVGHLEIFWSRVPIFLIGINCGEAIMAKRQFEGSSLWLILLMFVLSLATCVYLEQVLHGRFPLFIERMVYIPLTLSGIIVLNTLFRHSPDRVLAALRQVGTLSLEIYLIHVQFVLLPLAPYRLGYWPTTLLTIAISIPVAWVLHWLLQKVSTAILNSCSADRKQQSGQS